MYQAIAYRNKDNSIHIWDDTKGYYSFKYQPYAYRKATYGEHVALDGERVTKYQSLIVTSPGYMNMTSIQKLVR